MASKSGFHLAGLFAIATNIAVLIEMPYRSLGAISQPHISDAMSKKDVKAADDLCKNVALHQLIVGAFVFFVIWINIDVLFDLLPNGDVYRLGKWAVLILSLGRLLYSTLTVGSTVLSYSKYYYYSLIFTVLLATLSIVLNQWWVPKWDINGGALASVVSYLVYFILLLSFIKWKIGVQPFSVKMVPVSLIVLVLFALNWGWSLLLTPWFAGLFAKPLYGLLLDAVLKTTLFMVLGLTAVYKSKVSQSVNDLLDKGIRVIFRSIS